MSKAVYAQLLKEYHLPVFMQQWWLDAVAPDAWEVVFYLNEKGKPIAVWPYCFKKTFGVTRLYMPPLTPWLGPYFLEKLPEDEYSRRSLENKVLGKMIEMLPSSADIRQKLQPGMDNWLPFYWNGYRQETKYTYIIEDTRQTEWMFQQLKDSLKRQIKKAEKNITVEVSDDYQPALNWMKRAVSEQNGKLHFNEEYIQRLDAAIKLHLAGTILVANDDNGKGLASLYLVEDNSSMYYLFGGYDSTASESGAMSLLFWEALKRSSEKGISFNFEGSMLKGVERYFRSFGGKLTPVSFVYKSSILWRILAPV